jgi:hypothetical protein
MKGRGSSQHAAEYLVNRSRNESAATQNVATSYLIGPFSPRCMCRAIASAAKLGSGQQRELLEKLRVLEQGHLNEILISPGVAVVRAKGAGLMLVRSRPASLLT